MSVFDVIPSKNERTFFDAAESHFQEDQQPAVTGDARPISPLRRSSFSHEYSTFLPSPSSYRSAVPTRPGALARHRSHTAPSTISSRNFSKMQSVSEEEDFITTACPIQKSMRGNGFHVACFALFAVLMLYFHSMIAADPELSPLYTVHMGFVAMPIMMMIQELYKMT